jgi:hypothetical protein
MNAETLVPFCVYYAERLFLRRLHRLAIVKFLRFLHYLGSRVCDFKSTVGCASQQAEDNNQSKVFHVFTICPIVVPRQVPGNVLVEAAGIEPASASTPPLALHAYPVY